MSEAAVKYKPRVGRPTSKQIIAIERSILSTARSMFLEEGYDAVAMERVGAAAGVSKGTLYARYPSKEALFTAVIEASVKDWSAVSGESDHLLTEDIGQRLHHHARVIARSLMMPDVRAYQRLLLANRDRFPELSRIMHDMGYLYIVRLITQDIEAAAARDGVPVRDAQSVAHLLVSAIAGWQLQEGGGRELTLEEIEDFGARAVDLLLSSRAAW